jgi:hypothetical protein
VTGVAPARSEAGVRAKMLIAAAAAVVPDTTLLGGLLAAAILHTSVTVNE